MENITTTKTAILKAYNQASEEGKNMLENLYGDSVFGKITDKVKSFNDACDVTGVYGDRIIPYNESASLNKNQKAVNAFAKLQIIAQALNEGWAPDWSNSNEYKYYPWFEFNKSGVGFSYTNYVGWYTFTYVGSRLCFKDAELAKYAGTQFTDIYNDFLTL